MTERLHADHLRELLNDLRNDVSRTQSYQTIAEIEKLLDLAQNVVDDPNDDQLAEIDELESFLN